MKYTDTMIAELKAIPRLDYAAATKFAEKHNITARSVIAKARALELDYIAKSPSTKTAKEKAPSKEVLVNQVYALIGVAIPSITKLTVQDLNILIANLKLKLDA